MQQPDKELVLVGLLHIFYCCNLRIFYGMSVIYIKINN